MPQAKGRDRYPDVQEFMNRAMESPRGIRIPCPSRGVAFNLVMKIRAKKKDWRETYIEMYEHDPDNPDRNRDPFQSLFPEQIEDAQGHAVLLHRIDPLMEKFMEGVEDL